MHLTRYEMYRRLGRLCRDNDWGGDVLAVSGKGELAGFLREGSRVNTTHYPEVDIQKLPFSEGEYDMVYSDQVLEHVANPFLGAAECYRVLKPGGIAIHTSCLLLPEHHFPRDFWRFTPDGLRELCSSFSEIIECDGWGNRDAIDLVLNKGMQFEEVRAGTALEGIATRNERGYYIHVWVVAKK